MRMESLSIDIKKIEKLLKILNGQFASNSNIKINFMQLKLRAAHKSANTKVYFNKPRIHISS